MRLKKEYNNMVKKEISKIKKDEVKPNSIFEPQHSYHKSKSPDRVVHSANHQQQSFISVSNNNSFVQKSPYINNQTKVTNTSSTGASDYNASNSHKRPVTVLEK